MTAARNPAPGRPLRILQVVTLLAEDGAFGGPVSVARQQADELTALGHQVEVAGLRRGTVRPGGRATWRLWPARTLLPGAGVLGAGNLRLFAWLFRAVRRVDVVHVHAGRDLVSLVGLAAAVLRRRRVVAQTHGMVQPRAHLKARVFDLALVPLLRRCAAVLVLTDDEQAQMRAQLGPAAAVVRLGNGITAGAGDGGVAPVDRERPLVMFLARLHPRKRALAFAQAARLVTDRGVRAEFVVHGPDEGSLAELLTYVASAGLEGTVRYGGAVAPDDVRPLLRTASVYVLPSVGEIFPISLLEAMAEGVPSVTTDDSGIAGLLAANRAAVVTDGSPEALAEGIASLLEDDSRWSAVRDAARGLVEGEFAAEAVAARLVEVYSPPAAVPAAA